MAPPLSGTFSGLRDVTDLENHTDLGNARRLVRTFGERIRHVHTWGKWLVFQDGRWMRDETGIVERMAACRVCEMYAEAAAMSDAQDRAALAKWAARSEDDARLRAMVSRARHESAVVVTPDQLDRDPWRLNLPNGTLDLRTGDLYSHDPADLQTKVAGASFDPAAKCPRWLAFLERILAGDHERIRFVQLAVGYTLTALTTEQCLFFCYGLGRNGKTTFLRVMQALLGSREYARTASFSAFLEQRSGSIPNDIAALQGARLVVASEPNEGQRFNESVLKALTGGDVISARFMRQEWFEFEPRFKLWLMANHKPAVRGTDEGIWRRMRVIPFNVQIPASERDSQLEGKLVQELSGILNWAIDGCLAWQAEGLPEPKAVREATETYRRESDVLGAFLEARCQAANGFSVGATQLYTAYREWAQSCGEQVISQTLFGRQLSERGIEKKKIAAGFVYLGLHTHPMEGNEWSEDIRRKGDENGGNRRNASITVQNGSRAEDEEWRETEAIRRESGVLI